MGLPFGCIQYGPKTVPRAMPRVPASGFPVKSYFGVACLCSKAHFFQILFQIIKKSKPLLKIDL
jgi:hypothetical protein